MGLFDFLKPKSEKEKQIEREKAALKSLAEFSRKNGDYYHAFYYEHKPVIELYEQQITGELIRSKQIDDAGNVPQIIQTCLNIYDSFRRWCEDQPGGKDFYNKYIQLGPGELNRVERLERKLSDANYIYYTVVPGILERAREDGGVKQADLCHAFNVGRDQVLFEIRRLEMDEQVRTEKRGKYVYIIGK